MYKLKLKLSDPEVRAIWNALKENKKEMATWPKWKRDYMKRSVENAKRYLENEDPKDT